MRVAIVAESFLPNVNGVTNSVLRLLEHCARTGHEAMVIAPDSPRGEPAAELSHLGFPVHRVPAMMVPKISSLPIGQPHMAIVDVLRDFAPDVVHLASPYYLGAGGLAAAKRLGVPTVAIYQTDVAGFADSYGLGPLTRAAWWWTRQMHRQCDLTLAPSSAAVADLEEHHIPRVRTWGRGVDVERFAPSWRSLELRADWLGAHTDRMVVGFVGRLAAEKHVDRLASLNGRDDVQLVVVGDGPERPRLQALMPGAVFTGQLGGADLGRAYASLDVFVHPGEHETFCQAVQEALASGVPAIAPDQGGPRDLVAHCRNGYLLPPKEFAELLPGAVSALRDPGLRARFGDAARKSVLGRTWPALCEQLFAHYADVQGAPRRSGGLRTVV
ncbi:glycosyltransferase family 1 protein [Tsukamurella sp. 8F]|uniref:glycosyltransferase family 4 protein n=1 Tax=unclassified Tsukamurella TaxID=2633480 RepID=UPI0023B8A422|nr:MULTISPECIES: glycosyltransferase family 1 protein [unclassified Tsukamurella]MDF0531631.1 glycosyltransferase family 1 protein [Tsukamurella sp. 8J]MDF0588801.1 glycosyltransferase family 1 protein [Tsukamurella sp. 8F]